LDIVAYRLEVVLENEHEVAEGDERPSSSDAGAAVKRNFLIVLEALHYKIDDLQDDIEVLRLRHSLVGPSLPLMLRNNQYMYLRHRTFLIIAL
jgi:hypothetical protein